MSRTERQKTPGYFDLYRAQLGVFGRAGQKRIRNARVHLAGTGGLGSQILLNLTAAGVGHLTANDPQRLEADNLNRFPTATRADIGKLKIEFLGDILGKRPFLRFEGLVAGNENEVVLPFLETADLIVCCSNTVPSRMAAARYAIQNRKPLFDVAVSDARVRCSGAIRIWLPAQAKWSACPACYYQGRTEARRGEALLFPVLAATAAMATLLVLDFVSTPDTRFHDRNLFIVDLAANRLAAVSVAKCIDCVICSG